MPVETAEDLDAFFDEEEFGQAAVLIDCNDRSISVTVIQDIADQEVDGPGATVAIMRTHRFWIRADQATPATGNLITVGAEVFVIEGEPVLEQRGAWWICPAPPRETY